MTSKKDPSPRFSWIDFGHAFWTIIEGLRRPYTFWLITLFVVNFYSVVPPYIVGKIVDFFTSYQQGDRLTLIYTYIGILGGSYALVSIIRLKSKRKLWDLSTEAVYRTRVKSFNKLLDLSLKWNDTETTGNKAQRIQTGTQAFATLRGIIENTVFATLTSLIGIIAILLSLQPLFALFFVFYAIIFIAIIRYFYAHINHLNNERNQALENATGSSVEGLSNMLTIKTLGANKAFGTHIASKEEVTKQYQLLISQTVNHQWITFQVFNGIALIAYFGMLTYQMVQGVITVGLIVILYGYYEQIKSHASDIMVRYYDLMESKAGIGRMMPILRAHTDDIQGEEPFPSRWNTIALQDATFTYHKETSHTTPLSDITLTIKKGEKVGIVGKTGSGKSTLAKVLIGLHPLDAGTYMIGNASFYTIQHDAIAKYMTLILQESEMFNLTMRENITLMRAISQSDLQRIIHIAHLEDVVAKLPQGLDTIIGEKGYHLSGGERQRIGIARALTQNPEILILDEATSALDSQTEAIIQHNIEHELEKQTLIVIAHRVSTLQNMDIIYVFENGSIIESGTYKELMDNPQSHFHHIHARQSN